jgi:thioredoxin-dependent peroxiredoxin
MKTTQFPSCSRWGVRPFFALAALVAVCAGFALPSRAAEPAMRPSVGGVAPNFVLRTLDDKQVELQQLIAKSPVVLVVLRGWPGYQCPLCTRQVQEFIAQAPQFHERGAHVVMVYPGPAPKLEEHAREFLKNKNWPAEFTFVADPDYQMITRYGLRWDAKNETAYPSTFIIDREGKVQFAYVSKTHGDRVSAAKVMAEVGRMQNAKGEVPRAK